MREAHTVVLAEPFWSYESITPRNCEGWHKIHWYLLYVEPIE